MLDSGVVCLESLACGGINVSAGEMEEKHGRRSLVVAMEALERERLEVRRTKRD
jgi:hypothetical protein